MTDKFISIAVNQGDSFYLERDGIKILVDGGRSRKGFSNKFGKITCTDSLDVIVCTHADSDHINGLLGFFEAELTSSEIWLPGTWTSRLVDLLERPEMFISETLNRIRDIRQTECVSLEEFAESEYFSNQMRYFENMEDRERSVDSISDAIENASDFRLISTIANEWQYVRSYPSHSTNLKLFLDAIDTAEKIRELAILAYHSGAKIRWFEFDSHQNPTGGESYLKPVNSREVLQISRPVDALSYLTLSVSNKQSLVFYSPSSNGSSDVLFSADSDFSFMPSLPNISGYSIITTPHHGSDHNKNAYSVLENKKLITKNSIFVRSDGRFKTRPGTEYKKLDTQKACTLCNRPNSDKQDVIFIDSKSGWKKKRGVNWCCCN